MATIVGDVLGLQQCYHPKNIPPLVKKIKGFPLKVKSFQNSATCQKLQGELSSTPPPPILYHGGGMNLHVRPRVNCDKAVSCAKKKKEKRNFKALGRGFFFGRGGGKHSFCIFRRNSMMPLLILCEKRTALLLIQIMHVCLALILFASNLELLDQLKH